MFEEKKVLSQVTILPETNTINVRWDLQVLKDGNVIATTYHRCAYGVSDKAKFLAEVEGAAGYVAVLGW